MRPEVYRENEIKKKEIEKECILAIKQVKVKAREYMALHNFEPLIDVETWEILEKISEWLNLAQIEVYTRADVARIKESYKKQNEIHTNHLINIIEKMTQEYSELEASRNAEIARLELKLNGITA